MEPIKFGHPGNWREDCAEFCLRTFVDVAVKLQGAQWIPGPVSRDILYEQQIEALKDGVEFWRDVPDGTGANSFAALLGKTKKETRQLLRKGEKLRATVTIAGANDVFYTAAAALGGTTMSAMNQDRVLSVTPSGTYELYESWNVLASDVKVVCVPNESEFVKEYFHGLPEIDWEP